MIHPTKSHEAKTLEHLRVIFEDLDHSSDCGIYFVNVEGRAERGGKSRFNLDEVNTVCSTNVTVKLT